MSRMLRLALAAVTLSSFTLTSAAAGFGGDKDAKIKVEKGGTLKGKSTLAIGAFRVAFIMEDMAFSESHGMLSGGASSSAKSSGRLAGVDHALMQKIADEVYADFVKQATGKGYTVIDSTKLSTLSAAYRDLTPTENFATSRVGTLVIPTGQRSVAMAADDSARENKGARTIGTAFHNLGKGIAKADADKAFPKAAQDSNAVVVGVTIVVNFANFKGSSSGFGSSRATMKPGATIDGLNKKEVALQTSMLAWDAGTCDHVGCMARLIQEGQIHSDAPIVADTSTTKKNDYYFGTASTSSVIIVDPAAYREHVLEVAAEASGMLLSAAASEK